MTSNKVSNEIKPVDREMKPGDVLFNTFLGVKDGVFKGGPLKMKEMMDKESKKKKSKSKPLPGTLDLDNLLKDVAYDEYDEQLKMLESQYDNMETKTLGGTKVNDPLFRQDDDELDEKLADLIDLEQKKVDDFKKMEKVFGKEKKKKGTGSSSKSKKSRRERIKTLEKQQKEEREKSINLQKENERLKKELQEREKRMDNQTVEIKKLKTDLEGAGGY